jgi:hypothetical protein
MISSCSRGCWARTHCRSWPPTRHIARRTLGSTAGFSITSNRTDQCGSLSSATSVSKVCAGCALTPAGSADPDRRPEPSTPQRVCPGGRRPPGRRTDRDGSLASIASRAGAAAASDAADARTRTCLWPATARRRHQ